MQDIAIIYMGGTFGCIGQPLSPMPAPQFLSRIETLVSEQFSNIHFFSAPAIKDSSDLQASDWLQLGVFIHNLSDKFQNFIIIHGTDTLHYAAAFMYHLFADTLRIIITGSQLPLFNIDGTAINRHGDAWQNLSFAIHHIMQLKSSVYITFNQSIFYGYSALKIHTHNFAAFDGIKVTRHLSPTTPSSLACITKIKAEHIQQAYHLNIINYYLSPIASQQLANHLSLLDPQSIDILILQAFGSGNIPYSPQLKHVLSQLIQQNCHVILSSQVLTGALSQQYSTGAWLSELQLGFDPHYGQADTFARAVLIYLLYGRQANWQQFWS